MNFLQKMNYYTISLCVLLVSSYTVSAQILPDQYEPDNTSSSAKRITFNKAQDRSIHYIEYNDIDGLQSDIDLISFFLPEPARVSVTISGEITLGGLSITDSLPTGLGYSLSNVTGRFTISGQQTFTTGNALPAGLYNINVRGTTHPGAPNRVSEYTITASYSPDLIETQRFDSDIYEPDDSVFSSSVAVDREIQQRTFHYGEDIDWLVFRLSGCVNLFLESASISDSGGRLVMRLWSEQFKLIETVITDSSFNTVVTESLLKELRAGTYYISLSQIGNPSPMRADPYAFRISGFLCEDNASYLPSIIDLILKD